MKVNNKTYALALQLLCNKVILDDYQMYKCSLRDGGVLKLSSACVCHIDGKWCFYCEMYLPLVEENELLKKTLKGAGIADPTLPMIEPGDRVLHEDNEQWGVGIVRALHPNRLTATVDFNEGVYKYHRLRDLKKL